MDALLTWSIHLTVWLQGLGDAFLAAMQGFSFLGNEQFFQLILPALYWCLDRALGLRVGVMLVASIGLNGVLKLALHGPRPYFTSLEVRGLATETSFGAPSGHSQNSAAIWGLLAAASGRKWVWAGAVVLVFLIGLSRLALGVHFVTDVLLGWAIGALLVWLFLRLEPRVAAWFRPRSWQNKAASLGLIAAAFLLLAAGVRLGLGAWTLPAGWLRIARLTNPGGSDPNPLAFSGMVTTAATFAGLGLGAILLLERGGFDARGPAWQLLLRYLIGLAGVIVFWMGLDQIFPDGEGLVPFLFRFLRYTLVGAWISGGAPLVFIRLGLARPERPAVTPRPDLSPGQAPGL